MAIELVPAEPQHAKELGSICFEAFKDIHDRGCGTRDFPTEEIAQQVLGMLVQRDDFYSVSALDNGRLVGSNFLSLMDPVAGVGPITVDPSYHSQGVGGTLMEDVLDYARRSNIEQVRLMQDAFNVASLSLYASLGFGVKVPVAFMQAAPLAQADDSVRPIGEPDLPAIEELSEHIYKNSRRNEVAAAATYGFAALLRERNGRITGYLLPGIFGHGVAETEEDALALIGEAARRLPPEMARFFCPLTESSFYRKALQANCHVIKGMNYMTLGPYEPPDEVWMPSVLY